MTVEEIFEVIDTIRKIMDSEFGAVEKINMILRVFREKGIIEAVID